MTIRATRRTTKRRIRRRMIRSTREREVMSPMKNPLVATTGRARKMSNQRRARSRNHPLSLPELMMRLSQVKSSEPQVNGN